MKGRLETTDDNNKTFIGNEARLAETLPTPGLTPSTHYSTRCPYRREQLVAALASSLKKNKKQKDESGGIGWNSSTPETEKD